MLKLLAIAIVLLGMGFVVPQKAEAGYVYHQIYHVGCYSGSTMNAAGGGIKYFTLNGNGYACVYMGNLPSGYWYAWAKMYVCGRSKSQWVTIRPWTQYFGFNIPNCLRSAK